jgi:lauroyl/myristoyl acyltransferase
MDHRQRAGSLTAVIERVKPASVYDRFVAFREGLGTEVLPASGHAHFPSLACAGLLPVDHSPLVHLA